MSSQIILGLARSKGATVSGQIIEVKSPSTKEELSENSSFWLELFQALLEHKVFKIDSCSFFCRKPTLISRFLERFGLKEMGKVIREVEANDIDLTACSIEENLKKGEIILSFNRNEYLRLRSLGLKFFITLLPGEYQQHLYVHPGQLHRLTLVN